MTTDLSSLRINPPALSPSIKATTVSFSAHNSFIDSSIFAPSIARVLSYPARKRLITSALPSTRITHFESNTPELQVYFDGPYVDSLPESP